MFTQVFIERARRVTHAGGYINLYFRGRNYLKYKYSNWLMHFPRFVLVLILPGEGAWAQNPSEAVAEGVTLLQDKSSYQQ